MSRHLLVERQSQVHTYLKFCYKLTRFLIYIYLVNNYYFFNKKITYFDEGIFNFCVVKRNSMHELIRQSKKVIKCLIFFISFQNEFIFFEVELIKLITNKVLKNLF